MGCRLQENGLLFWDMELLILAIMHLPLVVTTMSLVIARQHLEMGILRLVRALLLLGTTMRRLVFHQ